MAMDLSGKPYYDRSSESIEKDYTKLAFRPDVPLQQSELNELQSLIDSQLKASGDSIFSDGDIVSGFDFDVQELEEGGLLIHFHNGAIYLDGKVRNFKEQTVEIAGVGNETVNVYVSADIVTHVEDPSLLDPTIGAPSESSQGADRVRERVVIVANDPEYTKLFDFEEGKLVLTADKPGVDKLMDVLAERTYDESGSYRVNGYELYVDASQETDTEVPLIVTTGKAYIRGYKVEKPSATHVPIRKATDVNEIIDESQVYDTSASNAKRVKLNNRPVERIRSVTGTVTQLQATVTRNASSRIDTLPNTGVTSIVEFRVGGSVVSYTPSVDYQLLNGNQIQWLVGGRSPASGATYQVTYLYTYNFVIGTDYQLIASDEVDANGLPTYYVSFSGMVGKKPELGTNLSITYTYFLARKDLVSLDRLGKFTVLEGQPNTIELATAPSNNDPLTLPIGTVTVFPNSLLATTNSQTVTNIPFESLQKLVARVQTLEYNISTMAMDLEAQQGHDPMALRGIFSDGFNTLEKLDEGYEGILENGEPLTYVAYSFEDAEITLPFKEEKQNDMSVINTTKVTGELWQEMNSWGRIVTSPYKSVVLLDQPVATSIMNVNPYMVFEDVEGTLKLTPANDNWISNEKVTITNTTSKTYRINKWWLHNGDTRGNKDSEFIKANQNAIDWNGGKGIASKQDGVDGNTRIGTITTNSGTTTVESMVDFMRQRSVKITAKGLMPHTDNLYLLFNGVKVPLTPTEGTNTIAGTQSGTVRASGTGSVSASFTVPKNQRCGSVDVELRNNPAVGSRKTSASTIYTAQGIRRVATTIINKVRVTTKLYDPLAQSFQVEDDRILTGVSLYFQTKDDTLPVTIQIRGMSDGGQPNRTIYAEKVLDPADVKVSAKGGTATDVYFDDPLMANAGDTFAIVIITDSANYNMFIATMGETNLVSTKKLTTQAYAKGVLFSSSNSQTWTAHQTSDLKFRVLAGEFKEGDATVEFSTAGNINMDKLLLTASFLTPQNTGCIWEMRYLTATEADMQVSITSKPWIPVANFVDFDPTAIARDAQIRTTFTANKYMSPMFALDDFTLMSFLTNLKGSYIGKTVDMTSAPYNTMTVSYKYLSPIGSETSSSVNGQTVINPAVVLKLDVGDPMTNGQLTWRTLDKFRNPTDVTEINQVTTTTSDVDIDGFRTVTHVIKSNKQFQRFKVRLDLSTASPLARPRVKALRCTMTDE